MIFSFGPANFGKIASEFLSKILQQIFLPCSPGIQAPEKIHTQISRPKSSAFLSNFTFLNSKSFHTDFLLPGDTKIGREVFAAKLVGMFCLDIQSDKNFSKMALNSIIGQNSGQILMKRLGLCECRVGLAWIFLF